MFGKLGTGNKERISGSTSYSFYVNRTIKNWNQLPEEAVRIFLCKRKLLKTDLGKQL
jgi:hypothetical protein